MSQVAVIEHQQGQVQVSQADTDSQLLAIWLGRQQSQHTRKNYVRVAERFRTFVAKPFNQVRVSDIQDYMDSVQGKDTTKALHTAAIKSLFRTAMEVGYLRFNPAAVVRVPKTKVTVAERIMSESDAVRLIYATEGRNRALLTLLYMTGARVSEVVGLCWRDLMARDDGAGQVTLLGKGGKTRAVLLPAELWATIQALPSLGPDAPVFLSKKGGPLDASQVHRIIKDAAAAAGLEKAPSAHWFRHSHATHALDRGAPLHLVQQTLGHSSLAITGMYLHVKPNESSSKYLKV